ncbi:MAG TPA: HD domain-containing protein [Cellvibrionaceae bacterium]
MTINAITHMLLEIDKLKSVERKTYVNQGARLENSAEHSWHLAMAAWLIAEHYQLDVCYATLLKMALVHDLGEIDGGDTFLYADEREQAPERERQCVARLTREHAPLLDQVQKLWEKQETGNGPEVKLLKVVDRLLPFMLNIATEGRAWREHGIKRSQVEFAHAFIAEDMPDIHQWIDARIAEASAEGWLAQ